MEFKSKFAIDQAVYFYLDNEFDNRMTYDRDIGYIFDPRCLGGYIGGTVKNISYDGTTITYLIFTYDKYGNKCHEYSCKEDILFASVDECKNAKLNTLINGFTRIIDRLKEI